MWEIYKEWQTELTHGVYELGAILADTEKAKKNVDRFSAILAKAKFNPHHNVRLLGDILGDRGNNDWLILLLLRKMHESNIGTQIIASNHDLFFLATYDKHESSPDDYLLKQYMTKFLKLITNGIVTHEELHSMMEQHYIPNFVPLSYTLSADGNSITLFMHAPNTLEPIEDLAKELGVPYQAATATELAETIDKINTAFQELYVTDNAKFQQMILAAQDEHSSTPLHALVWNRGHKKDGVLDPTTLPSYVTTVTHGHVGEGKAKKGTDTRFNERQTNLDTDVGKELDLTQGRHAALRLQEKPWKKNYLETLIEKINKKAPNIKIPVENLIKALKDKTIDVSQAIKELTKIATTHPHEYLFIVNDPEIVKYLLRESSDSEDCQKIEQILCAKNLQDRAQKILAIEISIKILELHTNLSSEPEDKKTEEHHQTLVDQALKLCDLYLEATHQDKEIAKIVSNIRNLLSDKEASATSKIAAMREIVQMESLSEVMKTASSNTWSSKFIHFMQNILTGHWRAAIMSAEKLNKKMSAIALLQAPQQPLPATPKPQAQQKQPGTSIIPKPR